MLKVIKELLLKIIDSIDAGNSNITEKEAFEIIDIIIPKEANYIDVYLAINSQYHNYICLFKQWFDVNDIDCKIIQSAIHYWFNDDDWAYKDKVQKLFK